MKNILSQKEVDQVKKSLETVNKEISKVVIGQHEVLSSIFRGMLANGHMLIEGLPGIAKTLIVKTIAKVTGTTFERIQFTADLLPTDILGVTAYEPKKGFYTIKGPIFANFILADEINRAPPKVQSALLEAMQERQITIGRKSYKLDLPFFVMATQNPIEHLGTFPLPEAQMDRFLFKIFIKYPTLVEEQQIIKKNIDLIDFENTKLKNVLNANKIKELQELTKRIFLNPKVEKYILRIVDATRRPRKYNLKYGKYIQFGASPRASNGLYIGAKANALMSGRNFATPQDVKTIAPDILRHRIILNYEGQAEQITQEQIINEILSRISIQ